MNSLYRTVPNMSYQNNYSNDYSEYECSAIGLYIINISPILLTKDLIKVLSKYGPITNAAIIGGLNVNHIYAYVEFADCGYAKNCYDNLINNEQDMAIIGVGSEKRYSTKLKLKWKRTEDDHEISSIVARRPNKSRYNYNSYVPNNSANNTMINEKSENEADQTIDIKTTNEPNPIDAMNQNENSEGQNEPETENVEEIKDSKLNRELLKTESEHAESTEPIIEQNTTIEDNNEESTEMDETNYNKSYRSNSYSKRNNYKNNGRKMSYASSTSSTYYQSGTVKTPKIRSTLNGAAAEFEPQSFQYKTQNPYSQRNRNRDGDYSTNKLTSTNQWSTSNDIIGDNSQSNILDDKFESLMKDDNSVSGKYWGDIVEDDNQIKSPVRNSGYQYNNNIRNAYMNTPTNIPNYAVTPNYYNNTMNTYNPSIQTTMMGTTNLMSYRHGSINSNYSRGRENSFSSTSSPSVHAAPFIPQQQRNYSSNMSYNTNDMSNMPSTMNTNCIGNESKANNTSFPEYQWTKINVSRLPCNITTEHIQKLFSQFGTIKSLSMKDAKVGNVVFLEYENAEDAEAAVRELDDVHPEQKYPEYGIPQTTDTICVDFAYHKSAPSRNVRAQVTPVRIQGLSLDTKRGEIKVACVKFGDIARTRLLKSENAHGAKCSAMVEYVYPESANTALAELAGHLNTLGYQNIKVEEWNYSKIGNTKPSQYHGFNNHANTNNDNMGSGYTTLNNSPVHLDSSMPSSPSSTSTLNENKEEKDEKNSYSKTKTQKSYKSKINNDKISKKSSYKMVNENNNSSNNNSLDTVVNNSINAVAVSE
ncbi:hypothetical protein BCR36DRAFT_403273 [Piromyces finnis]|uniref:RRM domain-containing protein n=1 Tax=Piromyces finnis TaxID=1754191 RepID=A0A1Y1VFL8_9FUNG|nr:hypothetical protein BCR36DRAFT_403273 [Piromyces finnis]|eukprot:ORX54905.1 hypothetical protein BCR36DRAFT_403273 [Piromyces finnis]